MTERKRTGPFPGAPEKDRYLPDGYGNAPSVRTMLEHGPLYRRYEYSCRGPVVLPKEIDMFCTSERCAGVRVFRLRSESTLDEPRYACSNCRSHEYRFLLTWDRMHEEEAFPVPSGPNGYGLDVYGYEVGHVAKAGQYPEPQDRISGELERRLGETHARYYRTAIRLRSFGIGIGALAYLRRVVEDTANQLLEILTKEGDQSDSVAFDKDELERVKAGRAFDSKMEFAKRLIPERLLPGGHNPLDKLHSLASEGLHGDSEEACVDRFDEARAVFEYFFEEMPVRQEREREFRKRVSDMGKSS